MDILLDHFSPESECYLTIAIDRTRMSDYLIHKSNAAYCIVNEIWRFENTTKLEKKGGFNPLKHGVVGWISNQERPSNARIFLPFGIIPIRIL